MMDVSTKIYKRYKQLNIFNMVYGSKAKFIKLGLIVLTLAFTSWYFSRPKNNNAIELFAFMGVLLAFYLYTEKLFINKFGQHNSRKAKRKDKNAEDTRLKLLYDAIKAEKLNTVEGIEYLIKIYSKRNKERKFTGIAVGVLIISAIINNGVYVLLMAKSDDWSRLYMYYKVVQSNFTFVCTILFVIIVYFFALKKNIEMILFLKGILFYEGYSRLIEILELYFLPLAIIESKEVMIHNNNYKKLYS